MEAQAIRLQRYDLVQVLEAGLWRDYTYLRLPGDFQDVQAEKFGSTFQFRVIRTDFDPKGGIRNWVVYSNIPEEIGKSG